MGRNDEGEGAEERPEGGRRRRPRRPLDPLALSEMALAYVARFATSRAKLARYLTRKIREREWEGEAQPDIAGLIEKLAAQGFVDDRAFAEAKAASLTRRGFGERRVRVALNVAGIGDADRSDALAASEAKAVDSALRFAERKRIGPFAEAAKDPAARAKALSAMIRAGHGFDLARRIVDWPAGEPFNPD